MLTSNEGKNKEKKNDGRNNLDEPSSGPEPKWFFPVVVSFMRPVTSRTLPGRLRLQRLGHLVANRCVEMPVTEKMSKL